MNILLFIAGVILAIVLHNRIMQLHSIIIIGMIFLLPFEKYFIVAIILTSIIVCNTQGKVRAKGRNILMLGIFLFISYYVGFMLPGVNALEVSAISLISKIFISVGWAFLLIRTIENKNNIKKLFYFYAFCRAVEIGIFGLYQYFVLKGRLIRMGEYSNNMSLLNSLSGERLTGLITPDPVEASFYLLVTIPLLFFLFLERKNIFVLILSCLSICAMVLTWSRSGLVMFLLMLATFIAKTKTFKSKFKVTVFFIVAGLIFFSGFSNPIEERLSREKRLSEDANLMVRLLIYQKVFSNFDKIPLFGTGEADGIEAANKIADVNMKVSTENLYLQTFVETGIIGGTVFLVIIGIAIINFRKSLKVTHIKGLYHERYIFLIFLFLMMFSFTFYMRFEDPIYWLFIAASIIYSQLANEENKEIPTNVDYDDENTLLEVY